MDEIKAAKEQAIMDAFEAWELGGADYDGGTTDNLLAAVQDYADFLKGSTNG